jgi:hypothetical protein
MEPAGQPAGFFQGGTKMKIQHCITLGLAILLFSPAMAAHAAGNKPNFGFKASAGYQYDSNANIAELDANTGEADSALLLNAGLNLSLPLVDSLSFKLAYDYSQTSYRQYSAFDLAIHHGQAEVDYAIAGFDTAVSMDRFNVSLDRGRFLDITQVSPSIARLFGQSLYLRGAVTRADKNYADATERNAINDSLRVDTYVLLDGMRRYLSFGYQGESEDAQNDELDYDGQRAMLAFAQRLDIGGRQVDLKTRLQFENRDYVNVTDTIGERRHDKRLRAGINAAIPLTEKFSLDSDIAYAINRSNLATAVFSEIVCAINVELAF